MFTKRLALLGVFLLALFIWRCTETNTNPTSKTDNKDNQKPGSTTLINTCSKEFKFYVNKTDLEGTITIANDANYLYITYNFTSPWFAGPGAMHVWLGKTAPTSKGSPGLYPFHSTNTGYVNTYTFVIKKDDYPQYFNTDGSFYFMTHATVYQLVNGQYVNEATGYSETIVPEKNPWFGYGSYTWCNDFPPPPHKDYCLCQNESGWAGDKINIFGGERWALYMMYSGTDITKTLWADENTPVGTVKITKNSGGFIVATYHITEANWTIGGYHFDLASTLEGIPHVYFNGDLIHENPVPTNFTYQHLWYDLKSILILDNGTPELCDDIYIHTPDCFELQVYFKESEQTDVVVTTTYQYTSGIVYIAAQAQLHRWCEK